jgi:hypothetical protein
MYYYTWLERLATVNVRRFSFRLGKLQHPFEY